MLEEEGKGKEGKDRGKKTVKYIQQFKTEREELS